MRTSCYAPGVALEIWNSSKTRANLFTPVKGLRNFELPFYNPFFPYRGKKMPLAKAAIALPAHDNMVQNPDVNRPGSLHDRARQVFILRRGFRISAGMVVD